MLGSGVCILVYLSFDCRWGVCSVLKVVFVLCGWAFGFGFGFVVFLLFCLFWGLYGCLFVRLFIFGGFLISHNFS